MVVFSVYLSFLAGLFIGTQLLSNRLRRFSDSATQTRDPVPVTLIKPVKGASPHAMKSFRSWLDQEYGAEVQVLFCLQEEHDPALEILEQLRKESTKLRFDVHVAPVREGFHGKTSNLLTGLRQARHSLLVFSDGDIEAPPMALSRLVGAYQHQGGIVSCPVLHHSAVTPWGRVYEILWNWSIFYMFAPGLLWSIGDASVVGGTVILSRDTLERLGGIEAIAGYAGDDVAMATIGRRAGIRRGCGPTLRSPVDPLTPRETLEKFRRIMSGTRQIGLWPVGVILIVLATAYPWIFVTFAVASLSPGPMFLSAVFIVYRLIYTSWVLRISDGGGRNSWLFILLDAYMVASALITVRSPEFEWGGQRLRIESSGKIRRLA